MPLWSTEETKEQGVAEMKATAGKKSLLCSFQDLSTKAWEVSGIRLGCGNL